MRQLVFLGPGRVEWQEAPEPAVGGALEAIVAPAAVATCDLDVAILRGTFRAFPGPFPLGHEGVARGDRRRPGRPGRSPEEAGPDARPLKACPDAPGRTAAAVGYAGRAVAGSQSLSSRARGPDVPGRGPGHASGGPLRGILPVATAGGEDP